MSIRTKTAATLLALAFAACSQQPPPPPAEAAVETYPVRGIVRGINFAAQTVDVEHEEIPGYMPAMTMPFNFREMKEVEPLKVEDAVAFQLLVTERDSWIAGVKKIPASELRLPAAAPAPPAKTAGNIARLKEGDELPQFALVDDRGRQISRDTFAGKPLLLTFIFTRCPLPNYCPLMSEHLSAIRTAVADDQRLSEELRLLSISFDPEYDTPEVLAKYAARYTDTHDQWRFATGSKEEVGKLASAFSVQIQPEGGTINHGLATALVGPDGVIRKIWRGNGWQPSEANEELRKL